MFQVAFLFSNQSLSCRKTTGNRAMWHRFIVSGALAVEACCTRSHPVVRNLKLEAVNHQFSPCAPKKPRKLDSSICHPALRESQLPHAALELGDYLNVRTHLEPFKRTISISPAVPAHSTEHCISSIILSIALLRRLTTHAVLVHGLRKFNCAQHGTLNYLREAQRDT